MLETICLTHSLLSFPWARLAPALQSNGMSSLIKPNAFCPSTELANELDKSSAKQIEGQTDKQRMREMDKHRKENSTSPHPPWLCSHVYFSQNCRTSAKKNEKKKRKKKREKRKQNKIKYSPSSSNNKGGLDGAVGTLRMTSCLLLPLPHWGCELSGGIKPSMCEGMGAL